MIADALKHEVEAHVQRTLESNPMLALARQGAVAPAVLGRYLASLRYIISKTPECLTRAEHNARAAGQHQLAEYFRKKLAEEDGHDRWAEQDIHVFRSTFGVDPDDPVSAMRELYRFVVRMIDRDTTLYVAYILWVEYFTVLAAPELISALVKRCGVPPEALSCISKHVTLDIEHTDQNLEDVDEMIQDPSQLPPMRTAMRGAMQWFDRACEEMVQGAEQREAV